MGTSGNNANFSINLPCLSGRKFILQKFVNIITVMPCVIGNQFHYHTPVVPHLLFCPESFDLADGDVYKFPLCRE